MKVKLLDLQNSFASLQVLSNTSGLNAKISYQLSRILKNCIKENKIFEELRIRKAIELADKDEDGNPIIEEISVNGILTPIYKSTPENVKLRDRYVDQLKENEVEVYGNPIFISELESTNAIAPITFFALHWLIKDESEKQSDQ